MVNKTDLNLRMLDITCFNMVAPFSVLLLLFFYLPLFMHITIRSVFVLQVQDIEFAQIEIKVIEGLKVGNDCLKKMHEVCNEKLNVILGRVQYNVLVNLTCTAISLFHFFFSDARCCP